MFHLGYNIYGYNVRALVNQTVDMTVTYTNIGFKIKTRSSNNCSLLKRNILSNIVHFMLESCDSFFVLHVKFDFPL